MSYNLGEIVLLSFDVQVDDTDTEPNAFILTVTRPDGDVDTIADVDNPDPGVYSAQYVPAIAGHYTWLARATGTAQGVAIGMFDVFNPNPLSAPLVGVAAPWTDAAALARRKEIADYNAENPTSPIEPDILNAACRFASEVLYALSGRQFSGIARTYCRPIARPEGWDVRSWGASLVPSYWGAWGTSYAGGYGGLRGWGSSGYPPEIPLNFPVQRIESVTINGTTIPDDEFRVDDFRLLVRTRPTADAEPTVMSGWPLWQNLALPDSEDGTFAVTYWYGSQAPQAGVIAAQVFAAELALDMVGADNRLPSRITEISRQGESAMVIDSLQSLQQGWTGIPVCDWFIFSVNPNKLQRRASVWTPDMGRVRTPTNGG